MDSRKEEPHRSVDLCPFKDQRQHHVSVTLRQRRYVRASVDRLLVHGRSPHAPPKPSPQPAQINTVMPFNDHFPDEQGDANPTLPDNLPDIKSLKRKFREAIEATEHGRNLSALDRGYYDGNRALSEGWRKMLDAHNLISPNINKVQPIINGHVGIVLQHPTDPQCWPRSPADQNAADIATKSLRYAADSGRLNKRKAEAVEDFFIEGYTALQIGVGANRKSITIDKIHPNEFFYDPHSREYDFRDARYMGVAQWRNVDEIFEDFPDAEQFGDIAPGDLLGADIRTMRDAPEIWIDRKNRRVLVVDMYYIERGQWHNIAFCHAGVLDFGPSPYHNDDGQSICPIVPVSCFIVQDVEDDALAFARYGVVRSMIGPQDEYNAHRAAMIKSRVDTRVQQVNPDAPPVSADTVREEAAKSNGVIPMGWNRVPSADFQESSALLQLANSELDRMGPTPAVLGRNLGDETSGRSRLVQQQAGLTESGPALDRLQNWMEEVYRTIWYVIKEYWDQEMYVRVSGNPKAPQFLTINSPVVQMKNMPVAGPDGQPVIDPSTGHPQMAPQAVTVGVKNTLAEMDMEIIIDSTASQPTLEHEMRTALLDLIGRGVPVGSPEFMMALKIFPIPDVTDIEEVLAPIMAQQQQAQAQQGQQQAAQATEAHQVAMETQQWKNQNLAASAAKHRAEAERTAIEADQMAKAGGLVDILRQNTPSGS